MSADFRSLVAVRNTTVGTGILTQLQTPLVITKPTVSSETTHGGVYTRMLGTCLRAMMRARSAAHHIVCSHPGASPTPTLVFVSAMRGLASRCPQLSAVVSLLLGGHHDRLLC